MLTNELNQLKESKSIIEKKNNEFEINTKNFEKKLKEKDWELKDIIVIKDAK
jgi:hypothetical protein